MTAEELEEFMRENDDEFLFSGHIPPERRLSHRKDINAFMILDKLLPPKPDQKHGPPDIVCSAEHDKIWLEPGFEEMAQAGITEEQALDLIRCGCMVDDDGLSMFV
jgi:hypothetical protein